MEMVEKTYPDFNEWQLITPEFSLGNQYLYEKLGYVEASRNEDEIEYIKKPMLKISIKNIKDSLIYLQSFI